jgi:uncharacterized DUF497 family protein
MKPLRFEWDKRKDQANQRKHGVAFEEAQTIFFDDEAIEFSDPDYAGEEDRFLLLGRSVKLRVILVCHCYRHRDAIIRIISARKATRKEQKVYTKRGKS